MMCAEQARLLVLVADWTKVAADNLKGTILSDVVFGHLKHAEVEVGDRAERSTCHENNRGLGGILEGARKTMVRK